MRDFLDVFPDDLPLPTTPDQKKLLLMATDYFNKWIEVEAFASIKDKDVTRFI